MVRLIFIDSAIIYVEGALNYEWGDAQCDLHEYISYETDEFEVEINNNTVAASEMDILYDYLNNYSATNYYSDSSDKHIHSIDLDISDIESSASNKQRLFVRILVAQRAHANPESTQSSNPFSNFSYRYNYNGALCADQPYYSELDFGISRSGRWQDVHFAWHGFEYGGAFLLERQVTMDEQYVPIPPQGSAYDYRVIFINIGYNNNGVSPNGFITDKDEPLPSNTSMPNGSTLGTINTSKLYSYSFITSQTQQNRQDAHNNLPCLYGNDLYFYYGFFQNNNNLIDRYKPSAGKEFHSVLVYSRFKRYTDIPPTIASTKLKTISLNSVNKDIYFCHDYRLYYGMLVFGQGSN